MNSVNITGRVGQDVELRYTPKGKAVAEINLAVDDGFGETKKTAWVEVTIWDKAAEAAQKYVHKGDMVGITGRLSQDVWEKDGKKQTKLKIICEQLTLLPNGQGERVPSPAPSQPAATQRKTTPAPAPAQDFDDSSDIPF